MSGGGTRTYKKSAYSMWWANEEQPQTFQGSRGGLNCYAAGILGPFVIYRCLRTKDRNRIIYMIPYEWIVTDR